MGTLVSHNSIFHIIFQCFSVFFNIVLDAVMCCARFGPLEMQTIAYVTTASLKTSWTRVFEGWGNVSSSLAAVLSLYCGKDVGNKTSEEVRVAEMCPPLQ